VTGLDQRWLTNPRTHDLLVELGFEHLRLTVLALAIGVAVALPLAVAAVRWRRLYNPLLGFTGALYTIPSLALFLFLGAFYSALAERSAYIAFRTAVTGLAIYSLLILFRNTVAGLDSVPPELREAGQAMGYTPRQLLWHVELPAALPVILAGVRVAIVTLVGLTTITALIGWGGFGQLFLIGAQRRNLTIVLTGVALSTLLATALDLVLVGTERRALPWRRA
jgi:osmoprotectant transport system permease protein